MTSTLHAPPRVTDTEPRLIDEPITVWSDPVTAVDAVEASEPRPDYVAIYSSAIFAVTMLFLLGVGVPTAIFLGDWVGGMGLGLMCAVWGGPSFGVMAGSARVSAWYEEHHVDF